METDERGVERAAEAYDGCMNGNLGIVFLGVGLALSASAQIDESGLRAKYGAPDGNGAFTVAPGIALKAD